MSTKNVSRFKTSLHPCSIEYLPEAVSGIPIKSFICGEYELKEDGERLGVINIYDFDSGSRISSTKCDSGILDMKIVNRSIAAVMSTGKLVIYNVNEMSAVDEVDCQQGEDEGFFLSVAADAAPLSEFSNIAVSTEQGSVLVYSQTPTGLQVNTAFRDTHVLCGATVPAWITTFDVHSKHVLLSGGDDCNARLWDIRSGSTATAVLKQHSAGVTSASWHPTHPHTVAIGSYDETMSIWDSRSLRKPVLTIDTGGGVWRTKWAIVDNPATAAVDSVIVAACMHGGANVFYLPAAAAASASASASTVAASVNVLHELPPPQADHEIDLTPPSAPTVDEASANTSAVASELNYGIDIIGSVAVLSETVTGDLQYSMAIASCSFYQNIVARWEARFEVVTV